MTSGTTEKTKMQSILSSDVLFPTESAANEARENEEEEEEAHENNEEEAQSEHPLEDQQEQIANKLLGTDEDSNNDTVESISEQFLRGETVKTYDPALLSNVITNLEEKRDQLMIDGDFHQSIKTQKAVDSAKNQHLEAVKKQASEEELESISKKRSDLEKQYENFQKEMDEKESKLEEGIQKQIQDLEERQNVEIQNHDEEWQKETKQKQYNRASQRLRVLRTQQQLLMNAKRFEEAEQVCKIADGVAEKEAKESYKQMLTDYRNSRQKLEQKHADELDTLMRSVERKRETFSHQKESSSQPYINRFNNLAREQKIAEDPDRLWILKYRNEGNKRGNQNTRNAKTAKTLSQTQANQKKKGISEYNKLNLPPLFDASAPQKKKKPVNNNNSNNNNKNNKNYKSDSPKEENNQAKDDVQSKENSEKEEEEDEVIEEKE